MRPSVTFGVCALAGAALLSSCVRLELEEGDLQEVEVASTALRISGHDSVVLCPLAAAVETSGNVSIVWAGYPASDDRLQLMHATVSSRGKLLTQPRGVALLDDELAVLSLAANAGGIEVRAVQRDANNTLRIELAESGRVIESHRDTLLAEEQDRALVGLSTQHCESTVVTRDARLQVVRAQVDGELPLFVENYSL